MELGSSMADNTYVVGHGASEKITMDRLNKELRAGRAPMIEARVKALEDETCDKCAKWEQCDQSASLWAFTSGFGKCRCEKFVDEYLWDAEPPQDGFVILEANCGAKGFLMGPKFRCPHFENKEDKE